MVENMFGMKEFLIYSKEKLKAKNGIELNVALEMEEFLGGNHGYFLDGSASGLVTTPLGSNDTSFSGVFSSKSPDFNAVKFKSGSIREYLANLKNGKPQLYLHQITVAPNLRGNGIGTAMMELNEYIFARYMQKLGKNCGFITGDFFPINQEEHITRAFYDKNGFDIIPPFDELHKMVDVEEVMDRDNRRDLERIFG